jgi:hypothetical protein
MRWLAGVGSRDPSRMHDYGVYILDTSGGSSPGYLYLCFESQTAICG